LKCKFSEQLELRTYDKNIKELLMLFLADVSERSDATSLLNHYLITQYTLWEVEISK